MRVRRSLSVLALFLVLHAAARAQEQIDNADPTKRGAVSTKEMTFRARVVKSAGGETAFSLGWKRGGQGLGGQPITGPIPNVDGGATLGLGVWSKRVPLDELVGKGGQSFVNLIAAAVPAKKGKNNGPTQVVVEMEFADKDVPFKSFPESAPNGSTVTFAFPGSANDRAKFEAELLPLSRSVRNRRERLEKAFGLDDPLPKRFAILGHHGGYGEGAGYGIRHNDPAIAGDDSMSLRLLGFNGMVHKASLDPVDAAGLGKDFRVGYIGGPGAGSPMNFFKKKKVDDGCPFDPELHTAMLESVRKEIAASKAIGAKEPWSEWWDEIGVAAKEHIQTCPQCRERYEAYLRANGVRAEDVGAAEGAVKPYPIWRPDPAKGKKTLGLAPAPQAPAEARNYYWTNRFMTYATGQLFPESAAELKKANIPLFAMQGPTPSWNGSSLDWFEFYDQKANTAVVWETSNRDPRTWQFESYLADIARGIARRLGMLIGTLVKPHRGAPEQRLMATVSRGATTIEWYNFGPDYARGDSFSQRPDLLLRVGKANRLLAKAEDRLYGARFAEQPVVAFVSPRSSEIWGKATPLEVTAFENAKWVYLALAHAHIPVDILSEQHLAEGKLDRYKAIYVPGTHLHHDAASQLRAWVEAGGLLWTDALGLSRDEANQPTTEIAGLMKLCERRLESWGRVEGYRATDLEPLVEKSAPAHAAITWDGGKGVARIGREVFADSPATVAARFADGKPAVLRQRFGKGEIVALGWWSGLTYSAKVRRSDFDMRTDFDADLRRWIAGPALERVQPAVQPASATVEAVLLDNAGKRSIVLMNWAYKSAAGRYGGVLEPETNLRIGLPGDVTTVRSLVHGDRPVERGTVMLPRLDEVDVLFLD